MLLNIELCLCALCNTQLQKHTFSDKIFRMSGRFFTFQLSGYESYLAENIASSAQVLLLQENAVVGDGLSVVCAGGVGDQAVVVDRLLLVLLHPFYRDLLLDKDTTTIFLPDVSLKELTTDFFGVLMGYCETFVEKLIAT